MWPGERWMLDQASLGGAASVYRRNRHQHQHGPAARGVARPDRPGARCHCGITTLVAGLVAGSWPPRTDDGWWRHDRTAFRADVRHNPGAYALEARYRRRG
jgi:hypothetical protein